MRFLGESARILQFRAFIREFAFSNSKVFARSLFARASFASDTSVEHAPIPLRGFYCHAKVRAYARCGAIRQSVGHNRPDRSARYKICKFARRRGRLSPPPSTKTINANDCMCSYIDGFIKISMRTRAGARTEEREWRSKLKRKKETHRSRAREKVLFSHWIKLCPPVTFCRRSTSLKKQIYKRNDISYHEISEQTVE